MVCKRILVCVLTIFGWPAVIGAQTINPNVIEFMPPQNQGDVVRYDMAFYTLSALDPYLTVNIGKPAAQADGLIRLDLSGAVASWPLPNVTSDARILVVRAGATSAR